MYANTSPHVLRFCGRNGVNRNWLRELQKPYSPPRRIMFTNHMATSIKKSLSTNSLFLKEKEDIRTMERELEKERRKEREKRKFFPRINPAKQGFEEKPAKLLESKLSAINYPGDYNADEYSKYGKLPLAQQTFKILEFTDTKPMEERCVSKRIVMSEMNLFARDYLVVSGGFSRRPRPTLLVRDSVIIISFYPVRAVITADKVVLFNIDKSEVKAFATKFDKYLSDSASENNFDKEHELSFELRALEGVLSIICDQYQRRLNVMVPYVDEKLRILSQKNRIVTGDALQELMPLRQNVSQFEIDTFSIRDVIGEILKVDEDLNAMLLTEKKKRHAKSLPEGTDHEVVELMLENYCSLFVDIAQEAYSIRKRVDAAQSILELKLDSHRNRMIAMNLNLTVLSVSIGTGGLLFAAFGMNLRNGLETLPYAFPFMTLCSLLFAGTLYKRLMTGKFGDAATHERGQEEEDYSVMGNAPGSNLKGAEDTQIFFTHVDEIANLLLPNNKPSVKALKAGSSDADKKEFIHLMQSLRYHSSEQLWRIFRPDGKSSSSLDASKKE